MTWAIMPPIEAPTTWAQSMVSASIRPTASAAKSFNVYGAPTGFPAAARAKAATTSTGAADSNLLERPMSRLSKRTTRKPRCASLWQNASGQAII
jgi:hypothetical protein